MIDGKWGDVPDLLQHLVLPATTLGLVDRGRRRPAGAGQRHPDAARATTSRRRGPGGSASAGSSSRHALRNALVPIVTVTGLQAALLMSGAVLTEQTFNWPGIGNRLVFYLEARDYTAVQGIITVFTLAVVVISLLDRHHQRLDRSPGEVLMTSRRCRRRRAVVSRRCSAARGAARADPRAGLPRWLLWIG